MKPVFPKFECLFKLQIPLITAEKISGMIVIFNAFKKSWPIHWIFNDDSKKKLPLNNPKMTLKNVPHRINVGWDIFIFLRCSTNDVIAAIYISYFTCNCGG